MYDRSSGIRPHCVNPGYLFDRAFHLHEIFAPSLRQNFYPGQMIRCFCRLTEVSFSDKLCIVHREKLSHGSENHKRRIAKIEYAPAVFKICSFDSQPKHITVTLRVPDDTLTRIFGGIRSDLLLHEIEARKYCKNEAESWCEEGCKSIIVGLQQSALNRDPFVMDILLAAFNNESCSSDESNSYSGTLLAVSPYP